MYQSKRRKKALSSLEILASVGLALGLSSWALGQDCGAGDFVSAEPCLVDGDTDTVNGGCNSVPSAFSEAAVVNGTISGTVSTYDAATRDTDWYLVSPAQLAAADVDGNGIVVLSHTGSSEMPVVLFIVAIGDPLCSGASVIGVTGWAGPTCGDAGSPSEAIIDIAAHPNGIVFYIAPGEPSGASINTGFPCSDGPGGFDYLIELTISELPTACTFDGEPCNVATAVPGCNDPDCCAEVCEIESSCCELEWDALCVLLATDPDFGIECAPGLGAPAFLANGPDSGVDGYLDMFADGFGSEADAFAGGPAWRDHYNPVGGSLQNPGFSTTTFLYTDAERISLSLHDGSFGTWGATGMTAIFTAPNVVTDESGNQIDDTMVAQFSVAGGLSLDVVSTQSITAITTAGGDPAANWTITYDITNTGGATTFRLVRWLDADILWGDGFALDVVGTGTNNGPNCERYIYQRDVASNSFGMVLSTSDPNALYCGSKQGFDPDGAGGDPPFGFGTDIQVWNNFGFPASYENQLAGIGQNIDGESTTDIGGDGSIGLQHTISLGAGESISITITETYGAITPNGDDCAGGVPCPADFTGQNGVPDGTVDTFDLLALLAQWGGPGSADFTGQNGVPDGIVDTFDLLALLAAWGPCP